MPVRKLEILSRRPYADDRAFGRVGPYERIDAIAHYEIEPGAACNAAINDLDRAVRGVDGLVHFSGDLTLLQPMDPDAGNRALLVALPNRGRRVLTYLNMAVPPLTPEVRIDPGDGFLFEEGWCIAWPGWQWDVPREKEPARAGLNAPQVPVSARHFPAPMQLRLQVSRHRQSVALTDQHVGDVGRHRPIPPRDPEDPKSQLLVRDTAYGNAKVIPRESWKFVHAGTGIAGPLPDHVWLEGGFEPGRIYDLLYIPHECPVAGAGLLAIRDAAHWLHTGDDAPTAGAIDHVIGEGVSQCGRLWRTFLHLGLNAAEDGTPAFDGILCNIAGARRGEFNHRYAQPSVQPTPSIGHLFPFADGVQTDPLTDEHGGLLTRQDEAGSMPKIIFTDSAAEYWRGDAALAHTNLESGGDAPMPPNVRRYQFAGAQHSAGRPALANESVHGTRGANPMNMVDYRPLYRACLVNLLAWVRDGKAPPPSVYPRSDHHTRVTREDALKQLSAIPGLALPDEARLNALRPLGLGEHAGEGIIRLPAEAGEGVYPAYVSALDVDGNETGGLAMPDVTVAVATHTGFNPRHPETGGDGQLLEYFGSSIPFPRDPAERDASGDPRPAITERYESREAYLALVRAAAERLVSQGYLLPRDVGLCQEIAARRYDLIVG